ncbi:hypothetical protein ATPR_2626 [Acetobacter tropicalis NBRC 101654]|uniref:Uncharacterized protein n=1 Tax=Acetobacter tropicalis NBRC 101654 TaxID=749388 RepID=F7VGX7_9PROT|nr:hypothetical protein ATPR_2626 [Acetobacter tropicalis NBRC 101654]
MFPAQWTSIFSFYDVSSPQRSMPAGVVIFFVNTLLLGVSPAHCAAYMMEPFYA